MTDYSKKTDDELREEISSSIKMIFKRTPPPLKPYEEGAACPWCGNCHEEIKFDLNICNECGKSFFFGHTPWGDGIMSWVSLSYREEKMIIENPGLMPIFKMNERLEKLHDINGMDAALNKITHYDTTREQQ